MHGLKKKTNFVNIFGWETMNFSQEQVFRRWDSKSKYFHGKYLLYPKEARQKCQRKKAYNNSKKLYLLKNLT